MGDGALLSLPGRKEKTALESGGLLCHRQKKEDSVRHLPYRKQIPFSYLLFLRLLR